VVTFAAVPGSWRKAPTPTMEVQIAIDPAARRTALETGRVDVVNTAIAPEEIASLEALGGHVFVDKLPSVVAIALNNVRAGPLKDARVRQALNYAVDKAGIADILWGGKTEPASQMGRPGAFGYNPRVAAYPFDRAKARALLKEAGYPNGFSFDFEGVLGAVVQTDAFQKVADDLAQVGVKMNIRLIPNARFLEYQQTGGWQGTAAAIPYASPTSDSLYATGTQLCGSAARWFCDRGFDELVAAAHAAPTLDQRREMTEKVMAASHDLAAGIFLYNSVTFVGLGPRIANYRQDVAFVRYEEIKLKN
jgi:peptide/nickel transport system substrate-binding protein